MKKAVYPGVDLTLKNVNELFLLLLGMRPRTALSGRQAHQVHADLQQPRISADAPLMTVILVAVWISVARLRT
jgi:hypothetical protein